MRRYALIVVLLFLGSLAFTACLVEPKPKILPQNQSAVTLKGAGRDQ